MRIFIALTFAKTGINSDHISTENQSTKKKKNVLEAWHRVNATAIYECAKFSIVGHVKSLRLGHAKRD